MKPVPDLERAAAAPVSDIWSAMGAVLQRHAPAPLVRLPRDGSGYFPLSPAQERLWALSQVDPHSTCFSIPWTWKVHGQIDVAVLRRSFQALLIRHESLRTTFATVGGQVCAFAEESPRAELDVVDVGSYEEAVELAAEYARRPFNLSRGPLCWLALFRTPTGPGLLMLVVHQIVFDGGSIRILTRDLAALYRAEATGAPPKLPQLPLQYADFAHCQREALDSGALSDSLQYWAARMAAEYTPLRLPADHARPAELGPGPAAIYSFQVSAELAGRLESLAVRFKTTLFSVLVASLQALLFRYTRQRDLLTFTSVSGRTRPELRHVIGLVANLIPLRITVEDDPSFAELLAAVHTTVVQAFANQDAPFERIIDMLPIAEEARTVPPVQVVAIFQNSALPDCELPGGRLEPCEVVDNGQANYDFLLDVVQTRDSLEGRIKYRAGLWEPATMRRIVADYIRFLDTAAICPTCPLSEFSVDEGVRSLSSARNTGRTVRADYVPPRNAGERQLIALWEEALKIRPIGIDDDFFALGGTSLIAARLFAQIHHQMGRRLRLAALVDAPTIRQLAVLLEAPESATPSALVLLEPDRSGEPLFLIPGVGGHILELREMAARLPCPVYGFEAAELDEASSGAVRIEDLARQYVSDLRRQKPHGPYLLGGVCFGAFVAMEMALQLRGAGEQVRLLALLDPPAPGCSQGSIAVLAVAYLNRLRQINASRAARLAVHAIRTQLQTARYRVAGILSGILYKVLTHCGVGLFGRVAARPVVSVMRARVQKDARARAAHTYAPAPYDGEVLLVQARANGLVKNLATQRGWKQVAARLEMHVIEASHDNFVRPPQVDLTTDVLRRVLERPSLTRA